jgi:hypothetical protein
MQAANPLDNAVTAIRREAAWRLTLMPVEPDLGGYGRGTHLDKRRAEVLIPQVEVVAVTRRSVLTNDHRGVR